MQDIHRAAYRACVVPQALRVKDIGGNSTGQEYRKKNFLYVAPGFLQKLAVDAGLKPQPTAVIDQESKPSSGKVVLLADGHELQLSEPPSRDGLRLKVTLPSGQTAMEERVAALATEEDVSHFLAELKKQIGK